MTQNIKSFDECKQLSRRLIAMNMNRNGNKGQISTYIFDYYKSLLQQPWLAQLVGQIRDGKDAKQVEALKKQLPFRSPHYFHFLDDHRAQKAIDPEAFTFQTTIDIDNADEVKDAIEKSLLLAGISPSAHTQALTDEEKTKRNQLFSEAQQAMWQGKVLHVERSARGKAHIDIRIPVGMTIAEAQSNFCKTIAVTEDASCITPERIIFITDAASEIFTSDDWYVRLSDEEVAERMEAYKKRGMDIDGRPLPMDASEIKVISGNEMFEMLKASFKKAHPELDPSVADSMPNVFAGASAETSAEGEASPSEEKKSSESPKPFEMVKSSDEAQSASSQSAQQAAPTVDFQPIESEEEKARKAAQQKQDEQTYDGVPYEEIVKALVELMGGAPAHGNRNNFIFREACLLRYICNSEAEWIKQVILIFGEDEAKAFATVESACKTNQSPVMPQLVSQAVETARKRFFAQQATEKAGIYADVPPEMPARLPRLIKLLTSKVPADFKPAVAQAVFPPLAAHLKGVHFRYIDNQVHEAAVMNLLVAPMSSGKSLVNGPIDCITEDLAQLDKISRDKEQEWKDEVNTMGDNKKKPVRPEGICIRIVSPDLTRAAYIQRLDDAQRAGDAYLYCKMDEVDMLKKFNDPSQLIRLCWDNSEDGQERVGSKSVTARVKTRFNWNASSTIAVTQKFFSLREVADGAVSRLCLSTIVRPDFAPRPVVGEYDGMFRAQLRPFIDCLNGAHGRVDCKKARQLAERLEQEVMETAQLADNKAYAEFAKRALANGYRKAMVLYLANGEKWEKSIEDFVEWSVKYDLWCKMRFFGLQMQEAIDSDHRMVSHTGPSNLLAFVPDTFSLVEIQAVYQMQGKKGKLSSLLAMWVKRGHISKNADGTYSKTSRFIEKYGHYGAPVVATAVAPAA